MADYTLSPSDYSMHNDIFDQSTPELGSGITASTGGEWDDLSTFSMRDELSPFSKILYRSIVATKAPPRTRDGIPTKDEMAYGLNPDDYNLSVAVYLVDDCDLTYIDATKYYNKIFPGEKVAVKKLIKMYMQALQYIANKYGVKSVAEMKNQAVSYLAKKRSIRYKKRGTRHEPNYPGNLPTRPTPLPEIQDAAIDSSLESILPLPQGAEHHSIPLQGYNANYIATSNTDPPMRHVHRPLEKLAILVWNDVERLPVDTIRMRLQTQFGWHLSNRIIMSYIWDTRVLLFGRRAKAPRREATAQRTPEPALPVHGAFGQALHPGEQASDDNFGSAHQPSFFDQATQQQFSYQQIFQQQFLYQQIPLLVSGPVPDIYVADQPSLANDIPPVDDF